MSPFHPEAIARDHAHAAGGRCGARPALRATTTRAAAPAVPCTCTPSPAELAEAWEGRRRMARARQVAGVALDALDVEALARPVAAVELGGAA